MGGPKPERESEDRHVGRVPQHDQRTAIGRVSDDGLIALLRRISQRQQEPADQQAELPQAVRRQPPTNLRGDH
jgi:hypothetical protein